MREDICNAKTILDVGCGTRAFGLAYIEQFPKGISGQTLIMSDLSPGMLDKAKSILGAATSDDFQTEFKFQVEDGSKLEGIKDDSVDVVVSVFAVFLIPDRAATLSSVRRVLKKPHGVFGNAAWTSTDGLKGFGVNLQDAFQLVMAENSGGIVDDKSCSIHDWKDVKATEMILLGKGGLHSLLTRSSLHSVVFSFQQLWGTFTQSPTSKILENSEEDIAAIRKKLRDYKCT